MRSTLCWALLAVALWAVNGSMPANNSSSTNFIRRTHQMLHQGPALGRKQSRSTVTTKWITQKLDHFDETNERTWEMRYKENAEFAKEGSPLFVFVAGEWTIEDFVLTDGHFYDMAKEHNGYLFYTEHRYYGQSQPTSNLAAENLKYLHVSQALEDLAHFIRTVKSTYAGMANSKVILVGISYSATMVTWFRQNYPELADGVWASSAPLFAKVNFYEYKEITGQSLRLLGGDECYNSIQSGIHEMEQMFAEKRGAELKAMLKICEPFDESNDLDVWALFSQISNAFAAVVQNHMNGMIQDACRLVLSAKEPIIGVIELFSMFTSDSACNDFSYKGLLEVHGNTDYNPIELRQWFYQTCSSMGWYATSESKEQPFGSSFPRELYLQLCYDLFGAQFTNEYINQQIIATNARYGGLEPNVDKIHFTHGQLDPWRAMGIQDGEQATVIPYHSHCNDVLSISERDSPEMRAAKEKTAELVRQWLGTAH